MSLFVFNPFRRGEEITPNELRSKTVTAFVRVLLRPLAWCADLFFYDFCKGTNALRYDNAVTYKKFERVIWKDGAVYELKVVASAGVKPTGDALSYDRWKKVLNNFIGIDERIKYNGQIIVFVEAINKHFNITSAPYIYVDTIPQGAFSIFVEIWVPNAVWNTLGNNPTAKDNVVSAFAVNYILGDHAIVVSNY